MTQKDLNRAVARATGECINTITDLGFSLADPVVVEYDPEPCNIEDKILDWDALDSSQTRYMWDVGDGEAIDAEHRGNEARFLNHDQHLRATPNLAAEDVPERDGMHVVFRAVSAVQAGEQLLIERNGRGVLGASAGPHAAGTPVRTGRAFVRTFFLPGFREDWSSR